MAKPRGLRSGPLPDPHQFRHLAPPPAERVPPFLLVADGPGLVLIAPFAKRPRGLTADEAALVQSVAGHLRSITGDPPVWVDPRDGTATPAAIGEGQLRRRLIDCASFNVRTAPAQGIE